MRPTSKSCTAPETISAAEAVLPLINTASLVVGFKMGSTRLRYNTFGKPRPCADTMSEPFGTNNDATSTA
eukprot:CAMPEP_0198300062 /NCGR_PEP_ID=MMETSP1449-20131203/46723_1 /TAXON_ID=420275 /ORGANISM="Attheya septentrionalis, Strain CCMP2084" /LENGTH=69 /DNA_ID=CAMNT_0044001773 /DNA_START=101 /DNA_END=306 /DNA_ORIENTATION=-